MRLAYLILLLTAVTPFPTAAKDYFVSTAGDDANPGTDSRPFRTIQHAADLMAAGDRCFVRKGTYRETVSVKRDGREDMPIQFRAYPGEVVTLSGTEPIRADWRVDRGQVYKTVVDQDVEQLFVDARMMIEARWPNATFDQLLDRSRWASTTGGSRYGHLRDPELAKTGVDWTGALATLNVTHQFYTWTRRVTQHAAGQDYFEYPKDFGAQTEMRYGTKTAPWEDDRYYLSGKREALDAPTEWFFDPSSQSLSLWTPDGSDPARHAVEVKARDYAFQISNRQYIELHGFHFFAATVSFSNSHHCLVDACHFLFPTYSRELAELNPPETRHSVPRTEMIGDFNTFSNSSLAYSPTDGLVMAGHQNRVENCLIHDVCWSGSLRHVAIGMSSGRKSKAEPGGVVRGNTVFRCGNAIINYRSQPYVIELNHVYSGGMACKDVALVYTGQPSCAGSIVRYNWVHGCWTEEGNGLGIRGDDQTRELTVHHNVVWDCGRDGIIVKGDRNRVVNNTCLFIGTKQRLGNYIALPTRAEPKKPWRQQHPLMPVQNQHSRIANNAARTISGNQSMRTPFPFADCLDANFQRPELKLVDIAHWDFRPSAQSPLVDAGVEVDDLTDSFVGKGPDVGAYEYSGENWKPGHHNGVWMAVTGLDEAQATPTLRLRLAMPVLTPLTLTLITADTAATRQRFEFTPDNWMRTQTKALPHSIDDDISVNLESPWGTVETTLQDIGKPSGQTLWFPISDIGTPQPLDGRFNSWRSAEQRRYDAMLAQVIEQRRQGIVKNLLSNGDFESKSLSPWFKAANNKPIPAAMRVERVRSDRDAGWCLRLSCDDARTMHSGVLKCLHPLPKTLGAGLYLLSYDVRIDELTPRGDSGMFCSYIRTSRVKKQGANEGQAESRLASSNGGWIHRDLIIQIPDDANLSYVSLQLHQATGTVYVDNVGLWKSPSEE